MIQKRWNILPYDEEKVEKLHASLTINRTLCSILVQRSVESFDTARKYFRPQISDLHSPWLMKDMDKAVKRILTAIEKEQKILVFGDYDVDGTSSVACMHSFLKKIHNPKLVDFYIPHRYREGYGISRMGIDYASQNNFSLIIALDCGIKSTELISYANDLGLDFIVCDHHLPDIILPPAVAILNPKQNDCSYPYKDLCGCGVGFKLITALCEKLSLNKTNYLCFLDLVATAIAADIVPLTGENRVLAFYGLIKVNSDPCAGIKALIQLSGIKNYFSLNDIAFIIAPRVNAAGRMDDARKAVLMFVEESSVEAFKYAEILHSHNSERKETENRITEEALALIDGNEATQAKNTTVVFKSHWHKGVVGIVASRLIEKYYRPTVVLTQSGEVISGSARSVYGFNLYEAVHACRQHLIGYGGHFAAAGMTMHPNEVHAFSKSFEEAVSAIIEPHLLIPFITVDAEIEFKYIRSGFYNILLQMEPFGQENTKPVFISRNVWETGYSTIAKEHHVRFVLKQDNFVLSGIGFNMAEKFNLLQMNNPLDIIFTIDENEWNGEKKLQLKILDIRLANK